MSKNFVNSEKSLRHYFFKPPVANKSSGNPAFNDNNNLSLLHF
jgi:hypothetical protein